MVEISKLLLLFLTCSILILQLNDLVKNLPYSDRFLLRLEMGLIGVCLV